MELNANQELVIEIFERYINLIKSGRKIIQFDDKMIRDNHFQTSHINLTISDSKYKIGDGYYVDDEDGDVLKGYVAAIDCDSIYVIAPKSAEKEKPLCHCFEIGEEYADIWAKIRENLVEFAYVRPQEGLEERKPYYTGYKNNCFFRNSALVINSLQDAKVIERPVSKFPNK